MKDVLREAIVEKKKQNKPITIMFCLLITIEGACDCERACECVFVCVHRGVIWNYFFFFWQWRSISFAMFLVLKKKKKKIVLFEFFCGPSAPLAPSLMFEWILSSSRSHAVHNIQLLLCSSGHLTGMEVGGGRGLSRRVRNGTGSRFPAALMRGPHRRRHWKVKELEQTQRRLRQEACLFRRLCLQTVWCRAQRKTSWFSS